MNPRYPQIALRAGHRCEYCHAPEAVFNFPFEVEHILPLSRDGIDDPSNWALACRCRSCNLRKASHKEALVPATQKMFPLFHPRQDRWEEQFEANTETGEFIGQTAIGRATVSRLEMNSPAQLSARRQWMRLELFP